MYIYGCVLCLCKIDEEWSCVVKLWMISWLNVVVVVVMSVGTKGVSQVYHLSFDDNKVLKIINWIC